MATVNLTKLQLSETEVLQRLLQLYYFESNSWSKEDICSTGLYDGCTAADLALYVDSATAKAYLIWLNDWATYYLEKHVSRLIVPLLGALARAGCFSA